MGEWVWLMCATMTWLVLVAHISPTYSSIVVYVYSAPLAYVVENSRIG